MISSSFFLNIDGGYKVREDQTVLFIPVLTENEWRYALTLSVNVINNPDYSRYGLCDPDEISRFNVPKRVVTRLRRLTYKEEFSVIEVGRWVLKYYRDVGYGVEQRPVGKIKYLPLIAAMVALQTKWHISRSCD